MDIRSVEPSGDYIALSILIPTEGENIVLFTSIASSTGNKHSEGKMDDWSWSETTSFRLFTPESLAAIEQRIAEKKKQLEKEKEKNKHQGVGKEQLTPQVDLQICKKLPSLYGDIPAELIGEPLEDLDPYYSDHKTFMVLNKSRIIFRFTATPALWILGPFNRVRKAAIKILTNPYFAWFIVCTVLLNCILLTVRKLPPELDWTEEAFAAIYTTEILIKIVATGFVWNEFTFLRDPWNCLDLFIIIIMYITMFQDIGNVSALRTFRVLRTLKAISVIPGLKIIVNSLVESVKKLADALIFTVFCLSIFALIGLQLFMGNLTSKCVLRNAMYNDCFCKDPKIYVPSDEGKYICYRMNGSSDILLCGFKYITTFTFSSQIIRTSGVSSFFFFMAVIFFCSFYLFNLILAVVTMAYEEQNRAEREAKRKLLQDAQQIREKEQELAAGESSKVLQVGSEMPLADLKNSKGRESNKETPILGQNAISIDQKKKEEIFHSQPGHSHRELRQVLLSRDVSVDSINDPSRRQRLMSAAAILTDLSELQRSKEKRLALWKRFVKKCLIWNCCPFWRAVKKKMKLVILYPFFDLFIMFCIILNTLFMAMEHPDMPAYTIPLITISDDVFTLIFALEMILKIIALDPYYYFQNKWNVFDSFVVLIGLLTIGSSFVPFRLIRIFKLAKYWPALNTLMKIILNSFGALSNLTLVLAITVFIFAVVGMQLLGSDYENKIHKISTSKTLRWHMMDFSHSVLTIFRILCGEWIEMMWECMEVAGKEECITIFLLVLVIGNLVVLNLFIALLLSSFNTDASGGQEEPGEGNKCQIALARIYKGLKSVKDRILDPCGKKMKGSLKKTDKKQTLVEISGTNLEDNNYAMTHVRKYIDNNGFDTEFHHNEENSSISWKYEDISSSHSICVPIAAAESYSDQSDDEHIVFTETEQRKQKFDAACNFSEASTVDPAVGLEMFSQTKNSHLPKDCFGEKCGKCFPCCVVDITKFPGRTWWNFRKTCYRIVNHSRFEYFMIFMIVLSSAALAFEDIYLHKRDTLKMILDYADKIFIYIFLMEMLLKWVAYGLHSYFTNCWCLLDFVIVCVSIIFMYQSVSPCSSRSGLKSLRTLRALRPLRALSRFEGIKVVVNALLGAIPSILNVLLVCVVFWLLFNILGVKWFGRRFAKCILQEGDISLINNETDCITYGGNWTNYPVNFDNVGIGYLALLQVATFKGWMEIMYAAVDSRGIYEQPQFEARLHMYIYFVVFVIFGSFFMLNLFVGVVINNFNQQRKKISVKDLFLTEEQKKYYNALKKLGSKKPQKPIPRPSNAFLGLLFDIVEHKAFDIVVVILICLNMVVMMAENNQGDTKEVLNKINYFFVAIFTAECVMKILALRQHYFKSGWNLFDFSVVVLSIVSLGVSEAFKTFISPTLLRTIRLVRIGRILRLVRRARGIRTLLFALLMSLPALFNIGLLLFLIIFIYAIVGMENFAYLPWEGGIDNIFNFQTFSGSILCLFQITTSAGWDGLLAPLLRDSDLCAPNLGLTQSCKTNCINKTFGIFYFVSYVIISFLIVVNMYIAVILENFNVATEESTDPLCEDDFDMFYETWGKFDPLATEFIDYSALSEFADALAEPLRIPKPNNIQLLSMDLPLVSGDKIHCLDILLAFSKRVLGECGDFDRLKLLIEEKFVAANPSKFSHRPISSTFKRKQEEVSAVIIQRAFRRYLLQRSFKNTSFFRRRRHNSAVFGEEAREKQRLIVSMFNESSGRKIHKPRSVSSTSLPLLYDATAETKRLDI
ncbi:sodium channel protein type 3 subunit alpha-like [Empidonax traillii]|uniref:sodium channel protein type 3 subunit alpha-like n=1 Tax=Empidonax traillii TaxID=164674 RepID=UPI000FFD74DD|nr:sodium channel protein type 3 subunit alpha-like [Empidonax traillii]